MLARHTRRSVCQRLTWYSTAADTWAPIENTAEQGPRLPKPRLSLFGATPERPNAPSSTPNTQNVRIFLPRRPENMLQAFNIVRGLEERYGKITQFGIFRDFEMRSEYGNSINAVFEDPQVTARLTGTDAFTIPALEGLAGSSSAAPVTTAAPVPDQGGISLEELAQVMAPVSTEGSANSAVFAGAFGEDRLSKTSKVAMRATLAYPPRSANPPPAPYSNIYQRTQQANAFLDWGFFTHIQPRKLTLAPKSDPSSSVREPKKPAGDDPRHEEMRVLLTQWARLTNRPDPNVQASASLPSESQQHLEDLQGEEETFMTVTRAEDKARHERKLRRDERQAIVDRVLAERAAAAAAKTAAAANATSEATPTKQEPFEPKAATSSTAHSAAAMAKAQQMADARRPVVRKPEQSMVKTPQQPAKGKKQKLVAQRPTPVNRELANEDLQEKAEAPVEPVSLTAKLKNLVGKGKWW